MIEWTPTPYFEDQIRQSFNVPEIRPEFVNLLHGDLTRRASAKSRPGTLLFGLRPAWIILAAVLSVLILGTLVIGPQRVYAAVMRFLGFNDPGLQSIRDAGLESELNFTAQPTILPGPTSKTAPPSASILSLSQTLEGVTLTLDWAYVDESRLALSWTTSPLPADLVYDSPSLTFTGFTPLQRGGVVQELRSDNNQMMYVSYQVIQVDAVGEKIDFSVDLPLVQAGDETQTPVANFRFDLKDIPVFRGTTLNLQQTYAHRFNGVEVRLESVRMMPSFTEVVACYDFPNEEAPFWYIQNATVQIDDGPEESYRAYQYLSEITDDHCVKLGFAVGSTAESSHLTFRIHKLVVPLTMQDQVSGERIAAANQALAANGIEIASAPADQSEGPGGWKFVRKPEGGTDPAQDPNLLVVHILEETMTGPWVLPVDLPDSSVIPGLPTVEPTAVPTIIGSQSVEGVTVTLDWVFIDALRAGIGYTITGLPDVPEANVLHGLVSLRDAQGNWVGGAGIGSSNVERVADQPGVLRGTWSVGFSEPLTQPEAQFQLEITLDGSQENEWIAAFPIPPEATPYPPGVFPPRLPDQLIGTYIFDFTAPVYPLKTIENIPPVSTNGLTMQILKADITASMSKITLCYNKPSERDWWVYGAELKNDSEVDTIRGGTLLYDTDFELPLKGRDPLSLPPEISELPNERCLELHFLIGHANQDAPLTLTIPQIEISPPEVIPDGEMQAAQEKLRAQGIEMNYQTWSTGGGGGGGTTFTTLPEGMTEQEAYQKYKEALGYVYMGPWVIPIDPQP